jgi:hypothetical protein
VLVASRTIRSKLSEDLFDEDKRQILEGVDVSGILVRNESGKVVAVDVVATLTGHKDRLSVVSVVSVKENNYKHNTQGITLRARLQLAA